MHLKFRQSILSLIPSLAVISFLFASCSSENYEEIVTVSIKDGVLGDPVDIDVPSDLFRSSSDMSLFKTSSSSIASGKSSDSKTDSSDSSVKPVSSSSIDVPKSSASQASSSSQKTETPASALPPAGFYSAFTLTAPTPKNGGVIRCTYDGSEPTSATAQASNKNISSTTAVRCYEFIGNDIVAKETQTYFINETISMPVVAISVAPEYFNGYVAAPKCSPDPCYSAKFWEDVEYPVHVEYFANGSRSTQKDFEIDAGISIMGGWSRNQIKKSVSIAMRKEYQDGRLKYPLFDTRPEKKKFKAFNLRNNGNRFVSDYIEDPMAVSLLEGTHVDYQRSRQVVVFYNGVYYGIHDMREKLNEHFVETNYGIDSKGVDVIKHTNTDISASGGTSEGYISMLNYAVNNDLTIDANYITLGTMLDIASYVDYMAAEIYYHNGDWPNNNLRAWHSVEQPWKFMAFDIDHGFDWTWNVSGFGQSTNIFTWIKNGGTTSGSCYKSSNSLCFHNLYNNIIKNENFRRTFINRAAVLYNSFVNSAKVETAVDKMVSTMPISDITRDMNKFPRAQLWYTNSCNNGFEYTGSCLKTWSRSRDSKVIQEFQNEFGLESLVKMTISATGLGTVLLDDIALPSQSYTGNFFNGHPMKLTASGNGGIFVEWEDGSTQNPRFVYASAGATYTAKFK
ncbi:MAG: CotH kinase family protein [Fibrobacter sp.]|uniref:CotH kinase family protein n=1 Tax=Fibrobacter sp. UWH5 TaxID=1896211 RepID=UPI000910E81F|nr:CotH kinase family protein [Fibrobacter sp. UWH5]MDO4947850.1 CotH kinase family protein [Fibrobacter sp.]SHL41513.1 CotH protein [Fibrobacter sp. UWH5]